MLPSQIKTILLKFTAAIAVLVLLIFIAFDSSQHFDKQLIKDKKKHYSGQKNWNAFYGQENVWVSGGLQHEEDFKALKGLIALDSSIFTDIATSYYLASSMPSYVKNIHAHHGRYKLGEWADYITKGRGCYLDVEKNMKEFKELIKLKTSPQHLKTNGQPPIQYVAVNRTHGNINFPRDCLSQRRRAMLKVANQLGEIVFDGKTITLIEISPALLSSSL